MKAEAKSVKTGGLADFVSCDAKLSDKWADVEQDAGGLCPTEGDLQDIQSLITSQSSNISTRVGGAPPPMCGFPATGQTVCFNSSNVVTFCGDPGSSAGQDGEIQAGAPLSYTDNGDGTITDNNTGLMWEKQSDDGSIHDWNNVYDWTSAVSIHIAGLNGATFAGYTDWRLPNAKELQSIVDYDRFIAIDPPFEVSIDPIFQTPCSPGCSVTSCSCTARATYLSSTTAFFLAEYRALTVYFDGGQIAPIPHFFGNFSVRAVRGGQ
jgi:hypothetical protein